VVDEAQPQDTRIYVTTLRVSPSQPRDNCGKDEAHQKDEMDVVSVLESDDLILAEITDIGNARLSTGFDHHPANVTPV